jgi:Lysyl oxidase
MTIHSVSRQRHARISYRAVTLALALLVCALAMGAVDASAATDRLPDLSMTKPTSLRMENSGGQRRLRMSTTIVNIGPGAFETRASRRNTGQSTMIVSQRIYNSSGGTRVQSTTEVARYAGDGHNHWHVQNVAHYELYAKSGKGPALKGDSKVGFCFFDTNAYRLSLPGAPGGRQYVQTGCGTQNSLFVKNGLSVGWSDVYPWNIGLQWINVTGLPAGEYLLKLTVNPNGQFKETRTSNNCNWTRIRIPSTGSTVTVLSSGSSCTLPGSTATPTPIPTGRVVIPPRAAIDSEPNAALAATGPDPAFLCEIPGANQDLAAASNPARG